MSDPVLDLINKQKLHFTVSGQDYLIACLNPSHEDSNPSLRVDKTIGKMHCLACGFKGNLFKHFGLSGNFVSIKVAKLKAKLQDLNISFNGVEFPEEMVPMSKPFRGISLKTLRKFGAFYTHSDEKLVDRVFFPIKDIRGKTVVFVGRHMVSQGNPRYINYPRNVTMPVFPLTFGARYKSVVLVEGVLDMLNVYDKGLENVACTFGTNTLYNDTSLKLLAFKAQGIEKIYLMYDGDEAGRTAMEKLKPILEELGYAVEIITLEDGTDPGDLNQEYVDSIKEYISEKNSDY